MDHSLFIHSATRGHLDFFQILAITNKVAINIHVQVFECGSIISYKKTACLFSLTAFKIFYSSPVWSNLLMMSFAALLIFLAYRDSSDFEKFNYYIFTLFFYPLIHLLLELQLYVYLAGTQFYFFRVFLSVFYFG